MIINVISIDAEVQRLCDEVAGLSSPADPYSLQRFTEIPAKPPGGVWIYDLSGAGNAEAIARLKGHDQILLVDRATLKRWKPELIAASSEVLLKPVSRGRLETALSRFARGLAHDNGAGLDAFVHHLLRLSLEYQEAEQDNTHFIKRAVYELRGPLTSLLGYCDLVLERRLGSLSIQQEAVMARMRRSLSRLTAIAGAIHQFGSHQTDGEPVQLSEVSYTECIEHAVHELAPVIVQRKMELSLDLAPCSGTVQADARLLEEVFVNVLDNSCKYTPRGGRLRISGYPYRHRPLAIDGHGDTLWTSDHAGGAMPDSYRVDISDNGPEIAAERLGQIFGEDIAVGRNDRAGSGLGLAICKLIVRRHRGCIWAESSGQGTTFSIVLPIT